MIDAAHQGKGYGRAGVAETIKMILTRYRRCRAVQLTCFRANTNAAALYKSMGFEPTGEVDNEFGEPNYKLSGAALEKFRAS
jgi:diamine N-acetyltransferase